MQYVRSISGSVSKTWNSINPATLSGAIDVVVVERDDGTLACSPFHVRFGKFQLLRPSDKKVEFKVNDVQRHIPMKVGDGGEAFFVFETSESIPHDLQTSPLVSPAVSPKPRATETATNLAEPEPLDLAKDDSINHLSQDLGLFIGRPKSADGQKPIAVYAVELIISGSLDAHGQLSLESLRRPVSGDWSSVRIAAPDDSASSLPLTYDGALQPTDGFTANKDSSAGSNAMGSEDAFARAMTLSKKLWSSNIPTQVSPTGDLMLDMTGYKSSEEQALRAEVIARKILSEELEGNYDIGSLIGADNSGNIWIYSSEEAKEAADRKAGLRSLNAAALRSTDAVSDPGYHSDDGNDAVEAGRTTPVHQRRDSDSSIGMSAPGSPDSDIFAGESGQPILNYAKTLRLTSEQLKSFDLKPGANTMSFTVNKATCQAFMYYWNHDVPIVISDIDGTITKSDALGHVLNMIGRDWTHIGVAKLYTDIVANGYHILYLTSRSVGQADTTRGYLNGVVQDGYKLPKGPVIMSPDRTMAALRREVYLRKPEVFKMACLRDIMNLFQTSSAPDSSGNPHESNTQRSPFYAGFGNRLTDALSYRSVAIPPTRIFTINSNAEVNLHLLTLNNFRTSYLSIWELVDHFFPPIGLLVKDGGEEYTDFNYWRDVPREVIDFFSESEDDDAVDADDDDYDGRPSMDDDGATDAEDLEASFMSRGSADDPTQNSADLGPIEEEDNEDYSVSDSMVIERTSSDGANEEGFLVKESRQLEALNLAAEETQDGASPSLKRAATSPQRHDLEGAALD